MRIKTTAEVKNNQIVISDVEIFEKFSQGQKVYVTIEDIKKPHVSAAERMELIKKLESYSGKIKIITPDGLIKREDAYTERYI